MTLVELRPYPATRDAGLPWLDAVPAHWKLVPNRALISRRKVLVGGRHSEHQLLSLTKEGVIVRDVEAGKGKFSADMGTCQEVRKGDLIFCFFDIPETPRTVGLSRHNGMITGAYTVFGCADPLLASYLEYFYRALDERKLLSPLYAGLRKTIHPTRFLATKTPVPPPAEQAAIVLFLDAAARRIGRCINVKQKLIKLLEEQKQAIIHWAVTRGVDRNVRLKPSGVEWLGEVPEHWEMVPNRALLRLEKQVVGKTWDDHLLLSLTRRGVIARDMVNPEGKFPASFETYQRVDHGDLIFCLFDIDETPRAVGLSALDGMITSAYTRFSCDPSVVAWVHLFYLAMDNGKHLKPLYSGLRKVITKSAFLSAKMPLPPPAERAAILEEVDQSTRSAELVVVRVVREIALLREFRARLIADVVTGKIDVRRAAEHLPATGLAPVPEEVEAPDVEYDEGAEELLEVAQGAEE